MASRLNGSVLPQNLRVTLQRTTLVYQREKERRSMFLSNIDQNLDFNVDRVHFFVENPDFPFSKVVERLEQAFTTLLSTSYDFLAGRLRFNAEEDRLEINCNGAGAVFVVAASELSLSELGTLSFPNPAFMQLVATKSQCLDLEERPLCAFQVTSFKCGAFAIGTSENHITMDGVSFKLLFENLASLASNKPLAVIPFTDRSLLSARSPPHVDFPHPELVKIERHQLIQKTQPALFGSSPDDLEFKRFSLTSNDILNLKKAATTGGNEGPWITSFNVVTAHIWRCKVLATCEANPDRPSTILYAVDIRSRLRPPLPASYTGNAVLSACAEISYNELERATFGEVVELVYRGLVRMDDEYARSVVDWGHFHKGFPRGDIFVSSWWRLRLTEVEFPWGRPKYSGAVVHPKKDIILLSPTCEPKDKGVNATVALTSDHMVKFESLFYKFLLG